MTAARPGRTPASARSRRLPIRPAASDWRDKRGRDGHNQRDHRADATDRPLRVIDSREPRYAPMDAAGPRSDTHWLRHRRRRHTEPGACTHRRWRGTFAGGAPTEVIVDVEGAAQAAIRLRPLTENFTFPAVPSGTYTFRVRSVNGAGTSAPSNAVTINFPGQCSGAPMTPTSFLAFAIGRTVYAMWDPPPTGHAPTAPATPVVRAPNGCSDGSRSLNAGLA